MSSTRSAAWPPCSSTSGVEPRPPNATDLWHVKKVSPTAMVHLTEKPVELARRAIEYSSLPGEVVLAPFAGSGSMLIACERTG